MKILKWSNSTSLKMKQEDMHLLCHLKNGSEKQMLLVLFQNLVNMVVELLQEVILHSSLLVGLVQYANEADMLNVALFGMTAKEWRENNLID